LIRLGIDVESEVIDKLFNEGSLSPREEAKARLKLAERYLREGGGLIDRDAVQASEKLYKSAEEAIKALAIAKELDEAREAKRRGRWTLALLDSAAKKLSEEINERIYDDWTHAYFIYVEGFHEARLGTEQVKTRLKYIEELISIARGHLNKQ